MFTYQHMQHEDQVGMDWKLWSFLGAMISLVLLRLGGMSPIFGVLGWRGIGCSEGTVRATKVEVLCCA